MRAVMRTLMVAAVSCSLLGGGAALAKEEPKPPGSDGDDEKPMTRAKPGTPLSQSGDPAASLQPGPEATAKPKKKFDPLDWKHAISAYARYIFVTELMLRPYLEASTPLNSFAVGLQYIHRFTKFDVVTTLDFSWLALRDGNWLAKGNDPALDNKYTQFDKLSFISADVAIIGHYAFNDWLELRGGAGLGLGVVLGDVLTTNNSNQVCNKDNAGDTSACYPISPVVGPIFLNQPDTEQKLKATEDSSRDDTAQNPHRKNGNKPPVMAVLNIMMALNFRLHRHVSTQVELGFRDAMFVGAGVHYHF
jgi:hypothetical protein